MEKYQYRSHPILPSRILLCVILLAALLFSACSGTTPSGPDHPDQPDTPDDPAPVETVTVTIDEDTLRDKIAGSWVAQMIGVTWAASTEFRYQGRIIPENEVPRWVDTLVNDAFAQDDLYVEIPFIDAMKDHGTDCSLSTFGEYFRDSSFGLAHANLIGRQNLRAGLSAADAGHYRNNYHADDIDWQIEADFLGNLYPGMVQAAAERSFELGHLMNYGDGVYGGVYVAAMHAAAMTSQSLREVLDAGIQVIPEGTKFRSVIEDVEASYAAGDTWEECWQMLEDKWASLDKCPECSGTMNIDAKLNATYIHMGLLWGEGDFRTTMEISMRCGQDSDCNPSSSAAILGTLYGLDALPEEYTRAVDYDNMKFAYTDYTLQDCLDLSLTLAREVMTKAGATKQGDVWTIAVPKTLTPVTFEQWPDDEITVYLTATPRSEGKVSLSLQYVLPLGTNPDEVSVAFDMGDGNQFPVAITSYTYFTPGEYSIRCTVSANGKSATATCPVKLDFSPEGRGFEMIPSCSVSQPTGGGSRDISVITDGQIPSNQDDLTQQYDTYCGQTQKEVWFALNFDHKVTVTDVLFSEGAHFNNGGWFRKTPRVELLIGNKWVDTAVTFSPLYIEVDDINAQNAPMETFTFTLVTPTECEGVRIIGEPGGQSTFASCSELDVRVSHVVDPTYRTQEETDCFSNAIPIVSETAPAGAGCRDIEIMKDGILPSIGADHSTVQYDTFRNRSDDHEEYFGYLFRGTWEVSSVAYTAGACFNNGGWFKDGTIRLEALIDGTWTTIDASVTPKYPNGDSQGQFQNYKTYTFTPTVPVDCNGIRIIGMAGGSAHFTSVSELTVEATYVR